MFVIYLCTPPSRAKQGWAGCMFVIYLYLASLLLSRGLCDGRKLGSDKADKIPQPAKVVEHPIVLYSNAVY